MKSSESDLRSCEGKQLKQFQRKSRKKTEASTGLEPVSELALDLLPTSFIA